MEAYTFTLLISIFMFSFATSMTPGPNNLMLLSSGLTFGYKRTIPHIPVEYYDERFTSVMAHQAMLDGGLKKKKRQEKALVDEISAVIILQA